MQVLCDTPLASPGVSRRTCMINAGGRGVARWRAGRGRWNGSRSVKRMVTAYAMKSRVPADAADRKELLDTVKIVFSILLVITSLLLVLLILLHKGKGGGLSDMFGGGVSSSMGGSSIAERNLDRITVAIGILWAASIIGLGLIAKTAV